MGHLVCLLHSVKATVHIGNVGAECSRQKGANAIDLVLVNHADDFPRGGQVKVLRTAGWKCRAVARINSLLERAAREDSRS